jgi:hypothetical protein
MSEVDKVLQAHRKPSGHTSVMASRKEPPDSLDFFPTPPWATRALCEHVIDIRGKTVWEPACGDFAMVNPLREYAQFVVASDVHQYGRNAVRDFLWPDVADNPALGEGQRPKVDWIITNPPFRLAEQFVNRGLELAGIGVAVLVRTVFLESIARYENLFRDRPPMIFAPFVERVPMVKGRLDRNVSTATAYCWLVWYRFDPDHDVEPRERCHVVFIPPCRAKLERDNDYANL